MKLFFFPLDVSLEWTTRFRIALTVYCLPLRELGQVSTRSVCLSIHFGSRIRQVFVLGIPRILLLSLSDNGGVGGNVL